MKIHRLKTLNPYFDDVYNDRKDFEVRENDRNFQVGDRIQLVEIVPEGDRQRYVIKDIKYILHGGQFGIVPGYVVLGLKEPPFGIQV